MVDFYDSMVNNEVYIVGSKDIEQVPRSRCCLSIKAVFYRLFKKN